MKCILLWSTMDQKASLFRWASERRSRFWMRRGLEIPRCKRYKTLSHNLGQSVNFLFDRQPVDFLLRRMSGTWPQISSRIYVPPGKAAWSILWSLPTSRYHEQQGPNACEEIPFFILWWQSPPHNLPPQNQKNLFKPFQKYLEGRQGECRMHATVAHGRDGHPFLQVSRLRPSPELSQVHHRGSRKRERIEHGIACPGNSIWHLLHQAVISWVIIGWCRLGPTALGDEFFSNLWTKSKIHTFIQGGGRFSNHCTDCAFSLPFPFPFLTVSDRLSNRLGSASAGIKLTWLIGKGDGIGSALGGGVIGHSIHIFTWWWNTRQQLTMYWTFRQEILTEL